MNKIGIILIHGAGLSSSIWDELKKEINLPILTIDFPNRKMGDNINQSLTLDNYANSVVEQIKHWNMDNFIIVAHSIGACVGLKVSEHFKKELKGFVAIGSVIPTNGNSFVSSLPLPQKLLLPFILKMLGTKPPQKLIENELCNDLTAEQTQKIINEFTPESKKLYMTKITFNLPAKKRLYIQLTNDQSIPASWQSKMIEHLQATKVVTIESGHLPMLSKTKEVATTLLDFINEIEHTEKAFNY